MRLAPSAWCRPGASPQESGPPSGQSHPGRRCDNDRIARGSARSSVKLGARGGLGIVHSRAQDDSSGLSFGTPFAFNFGGGLKFVPGGRLQLRGDITDRLQRGDNVGEGAAGGV